MRIASVALLFALLAGCAGPTFVVQQYPGEVRPRETLAVLRVNGGEPVRLTTLDGEDVAVPIQNDARLHIELLPGPHTLSVKDANAPREPAVPLVFQGEAGKVYRVVLGRAGGEAAGPLARVVEVDRGSDVVGRDAPLPPAPAPPAPAPAPPPAAAPPPAPAPVAPEPPPAPAPQP